MKNISIKRNTTADAIYEQLRKDIINLYFSPGEKLSEAKLAEHYGVSRDPVRKSVSRLVQEGLLISKPQYGTIVSSVSIKQGIDICEIRLLLESYAIRKAVKNLKEEIIDELIYEQECIEKRINLQDDEAIKQEIYALDGKMHQAIYDASGNTMVSSIIESYEYIIKRIQIANMMWHSRKNATMKEMHDIIFALKNRDEEAAVEAMRTHINNIKTTVATPTKKKE